MKVQERKYLWLIICFALICLIAKGFVFAQDKPPTHPPITNQINAYPALPASDKPSTTPPQEVKNEFAGSPVTDMPPTHPPQVENLQNNQIDNGATAYPPPPPPVEAPKPVFGGPVNDKLPDPPTGPPDKTSRGIKEIHVNFPSPVAGIKDEVIQIDTTMRQGASSQDAMPMGTISASPKESEGMKKDTEKISSPARILGKGQLNPVDKPMTERMLKKQNVTKQGTNIPTLEISKPKPTPTPKPTPIPPSDQYPSWINEVIAKEESEPVANPPASLSGCMYKNQTVYYLPPRCCDISSVLFNENGEVICAPDGGFTGGGDGRCPDFFEERKDCEIIWEDSRASH
jgi:hypothetical protein